ncbi:MAG: hypothetical protein AB8C95_04435, partial [Phycisphaeraceae bacterium]
MAEDLKQDDKRWAKGRLWFGLFGLGAYGVFLYLLVLFHWPLRFFFVSVPLLFFFSLFVAWASPDFSWENRAGRGGYGIGSEMDAGGFGGGGGCD